MVADWGGTSGGKDRKDEDSGKAGFRSEKRGNFFLN